MAAPVDADRVTYDGSTQSTSHNVTLPGSISSGDFLVMFVRAPEPDYLSTYTGWTYLAGTDGDASDDVTYVLTRVADGTEGGTTTLTFTGSTRLTAITYRITGTATLGAYVDVQNGNWNVGNSSTPDSYGGVYHGDALVLSLIGMAGGAYTITTAPTGYGNATATNNTGATGSGQCTVAVASKQVTGGTGAVENPGAWTMSGSNVWAAITVIVQTENAYARLTAEPVEVAYLPDAPKARLTALPVEVAVTPNPPLRVTQFPVEALVQPTDSKVRLSQYPVEVLIEIPRITAPPFLAYIID